MLHLHEAALLLDKEDCWFGRLGCLDAEVGIWRGSVHIFEESHNMRQGRARALG